MWSGGVNEADGVSLGWTSL